MAKKGKLARKRVSATTVALTGDLTRDIYSSRRFLDRGTHGRLGLSIPFHVYYKDPLVARMNPGLEIDEHFHVPWEPNISDGPTSARFAIVDYDSTTNKLESPARWDAQAKVFLDPSGRKVDRKIKDTAHFRQVSTWAILQSTLDYFESPSGLGRRIPWAFEGNRLLVTPSAGQTANAYYDRESKSLQFYYIDDENDNRIYTCLSSDIVNHEFGHALLDAIRPHYLEAVSLETSAFHEYLGDLTAILMTLRNGSFLWWFGRMTQGDLTSKSGRDLLASVAAEFGKAVADQPYLRSAANQLTMRDLKGTSEPHVLSQVMTGAMFDIFIALTKQYLERLRSGRMSRRQSVLQMLQGAMRSAVVPMQVIAIQALDFLPPADVTFNDYARAILRNLTIADPTDSDGHRRLTAKILTSRGVITKGESDEFLAVGPLYERMPGTITHNPELIGRSRAEAYRYLDDNRDKLFIPDNVDLIVEEVFTPEKMLWRGLSQPKQVILQYLWREELVLAGRRFGAYEGKTTSLLCGGTMVFDVNGSMLYWMRKPGVQPSAIAINALRKSSEGRTLFGTERAALAEMKTGKARRRGYLNALAHRIEEGMVGDELASPGGIVSGLTPPLIAREVSGSVRFELAPHFHLDDEDNSSSRGRRWRTSS